MSTLTARVFDALAFGRVLFDVDGFIRRYVVLTDDQVVAADLWTAHTHAIQAFDCTPYLQVTSATKRAGKTRLLETLEPLVARPWLTGRMSAAVLIRKVDAERPTLLLDESDAAFNGEREYAEALRGILNTGYRSSGKASLCVGQGNTISYRDFRTFGAKAIAGIGELPGTISDRAIRIELRRRTNDEPCARWRERDGHAEAAPLREQLALWAGRPAVIDTLRAARPALPPELGDRQADVWEPLLAIADLIGGDWPDRARRAAVTLAGAVEDSDINVELLHDIYEVFDSEPAAFIASKQLVAALAALDSRPWGDWKDGKPISQRAVADRLKKFDIIPKSNGSARGYHRDRFEDAWSRFPPSKPSNRQNLNEPGAELAFLNRQTVSGVDTLKTQESPMNTGLLDGLTLQKPDRVDWRSDDGCRRVEP